MVVAAAGGGLLAGLSSTVYVMRQPSLYASSTTLVVGSFIQDPNPSGNEFYLAQQLADSYANFVQRGTIRQATMQALGMDWLPEYSACASAQLLEITVTDVDPQRAQRVAQELANQIIEASPAGQAEQGHQAFVGQRLQKLETDIEPRKMRLNASRRRWQMSLAPPRSRDCRMKSQYYQAR